MKRVDFEASPALLRDLRNVALASVLLFLAGLYVDPMRAWVAFLVAYALFVGLALSGPFFLSLLTLARARWPGELRRIPEAFTTALPAAALLGIVLLSGVHTLYEWSHPSAVQADPLLAHKASFLNWIGFAVRMGVYFALWIALAGQLVRALHAQDADPSAAASRRSIRCAALFLAVFAITFSLASIDWIESIEPRWSSTIFALVTLSTLALAGLAACALIVARAAHDPRLRDLATTARVDDLGRILIGVSLFWAYIGYCQHMLIWYTNMPEETSWYVVRSQGEWATVGRVCLALCWLTPFLVLMPRKLRRNPTVLGRVAIAVTIGVVHHLYWLIAPPLHGAAPQFGLLELALPLGALAGVFHIVLRNLSRADLTMPPAVEPRPISTPVRV
jgi:hypothetical protein